MARRLVERGVRFIQVYLGSGSAWDAHSDLEGNHSNLCKETDQPVAAFLSDLKRRGLLEETLVIWGGEFGRTPMSESGDGRDHNPWGFSMWFAGGSAEAGRDRMYQAVLPLRGKPLNVEKCRLENLLNNTEICSLISAIGVDIGNQQDYETVRSEKC